MTPEQEGLNTIDGEYTVVPGSAKVTVVYHPCANCYCFRLVDGKSFCRLYSVYLSDDMYEYCQVPL